MKSVKRGAGLTRVQWLLLVLLFPLALWGMGAIWETTPELLQGNCKLPLAAAPEGFYMGACERLMLISHDGDIVAQASLESLNLSNRLYSMSFSGTTLYLADMRAPAIVECAADLSRCESHPVRLIGAGSWRIAFHQNGLWVAEPDAGQVFKMDAEWERGLILAREMGLKEPRDLVFDGDAMWIADRGKRVLLAISGLDSTVKRESKIFVSEAELAHVAPGRVLPVTGGDLWVMMSDDLDKGRGLLRLSRSGEVLERLTLPPARELFDLVAAPDGLLVSDLGGPYLHRVAGGRLQAFAPGSEADAFLADLRARDEAVKQRHLLGFGAVIAALFIWVFARSWNLDTLLKTSRVEAEDAGIVWIRRIPLHGTVLHYLKRFMPIHVVAMFVMFNLEFDVYGWDVFRSDLFWWMVLLPLGLGVMIWLWSLSYSRHGIGILGTRVYIDLGGGGIHMAEAAELVYSEEWIMIGEARLDISPTDQPGGFPEASIEKHLRPLLQAATYVESKWYSHYKYANKSTERAAMVSLLLLLVILAWSHLWS